MVKESLSAVLLVWGAACGGTRVGPSDGELIGDSGVDAAPGERDSGAPQEVDATASAECERLQPLPPIPVDLAPGTAKKWAEFPSSASGPGRRHRYRLRPRAGTLFLSTSPDPVRIDLTTDTWSHLCASETEDDVVQDILPIPNESVVIVVYARGEQDGFFRYRPDSGSPWTTARAPAALDGAAESALVWHELSSTVLATFPGSRLLVSRDHGASFEEVVPGGWCPGHGFTIDRSGTSLWYVSECALDRVASYKMPLSALGPAADSWAARVHPELDANGIYSAVADPHSPAGIYLGGEATLAYLGPDASQDRALDVRWQLPESSPDDEYVYVEALWADSTTRDHVVFGGAPQGGGPATALESTAGGLNPVVLGLEPRVAGSVVAIEEVPSAERILGVAVEEPTRVSLYLLRL